MKVVHVLRKPLSEGSVAANVLRHGTGAIHIDASRISTGDSLGGGAMARTGADQKGNEGWTRPWMSDPDAREAHAERVRANVVKAEALGRWPANLVLQHLEGCGPDGCAPGCPLPVLDAQSGTTKSSGGRAYQNTNDMYSGGWGHKGSGVAMDPGYGDVGGVSRYYKQVGGHDDDPTG